MQAPSARIRFCLKTDIFSLRFDLPFTNIRWKSIFSKTLSRVEIFENASFSFTRPETVFEYDDVIHHILLLAELLAWCYQISIVLAFLCWRAKTISIRYVGCVCFFENENKKTHTHTHSPFSKIFEYMWTGPHTRISTRTIAFAHYTLTHFSYWHKVNAYSRGNICQETLTLVPFSFPRTFRRIFLTLLDNVTLLVESLRQVVFKVSLSVDVWTKNIRMTARRSCLPFLQVLWSFSNRDKALSTRIRTFFGTAYFLSGFVWTGTWTAVANGFKTMRPVLVSEFTGFVWTKGRFV